VTQPGGAQRVVFWAMVAEWLLLVPDLLAALLSGSVTMYATLLRSGVEVIAVTIAWWAMRRIAGGNAARYDYGVGKLENLTSLGVAATLAVSLLILLYEVYERIRHPETLDPHHCGVALGITLVACCIDTWFLLKYRRLAKTARSPLLAAQWRVYRIKVVSGGIALAALGITVGFSDRSWAAYSDPFGSLGMAVIIMATVGSLFRNAVTELMDCTLDESLQLAIDRVLAGRFDDYAHFHGVRSRRSGSDIFIEILLEFDGAKRMAEVQAAIDRISSEVQRAIPGSRVLVAPVRARPG